LGVAIDNLTMDEAIGDILAAAADSEPKTFAFVNADCLNKAVGNASYARILSRQFRVFADGSGIRWASRLRGLEVRENVNGTDLFPLLCHHAAKRGLGIYLLGAKPGVAAEAARRIKEVTPDLVVSGTRDGFFSAHEEEDVIEKINASGSGILLVAMGAPRQEEWIERNRSRLSVGVVIGVGGLFDFFAGRVSRAPLGLRRTGFEWVWRFLQEPSRMWRRYIIGNPVFLWRCMREQLTQKHYRSAHWSEQGSARRAFLKRLGWRFSNAAHRRAKRLLDIVLSAAGLALLAPLFLMIAAAIKLDSSGPLLFSQTRVGFRGKRFRMWKFRSMYIDAEARRAALLAQSDRTGAHFKMKHDPRITRIGRLIRRASIDELPQLINVLRGEMSIVGPRPNLEAEVAKYNIDEFGRLDTKPGITCIWQVSGRAEIPWERQVEMDLDYVYAPSLGSDITLIIRTLPAMLSGKGAY
jgi:exopolysaccharide biosynthesis WecB/TagA/CpsF family protein